jgi:tRNA G26 N,N-dimethylase Trm1
MADVGLALRQRLDFGRVRVVAKDTATCGVESVHQREADVAEPDHSYLRRSVLQALAQLGVRGIRRRAEAFCSRTVVAAITGRCYSRRVERHVERMAHVPDAQSVHTQQPGIVARQCRRHVSVAQRSAFTPG